MEHSYTEFAGFSTTGSLAIDRQLSIDDVSLNVFLQIQSGTYIRQKSGNIM